MTFSDTPESHTLSTAPLRHQFLIEAAIKLHRYGTPSHRLERVLTDVATSLGTRGDFLYTPTGLA
ncbi:MAG: threonine/serine exporter family protein, partial [Planctomycetota bacterium]